nr:hypothetical protein [Candidatus Sigynarchaeota archaeon]
GDLFSKEVRHETTPDDTHAEIRPALVSIPGDALDAVVRAGSMLEAAGDFKDAAALYNHFIITLRLHVLLPIGPSESDKKAHEDAPPNKELLDWRVVRANAARFTLA